MSQIEIAQIIEQIKQEITVDSNGHGRASIRATARLANVDATGLARSLKTSVDNSGSKLVEKLIRKGFEGVEILSWSQSGIPDLAVAVIIRYYAYEAGKRCNEQAKLVCEAFEGIGVRAWIQDSVGWTKPAAPPTETPMTQIQVLAAIAQHLAEQEQRLLEQQQQQQEILHRIKAVEVEQDRYLTPCGHKFSVVGFANLQGLEISAKEASSKGKKASALCRQQGIEIERIHDRTIRNSQFAIRNWGCNSKLIHLGIQASNFNYVTFQIRSINIQAPNLSCGVIIANCELEIANWR